MQQHSLTLFRLIPFLFVLLWSTGFIGAKYALPYIEPFYLLFIRMLMTLAVFLALCMIFKPRWPSLTQAGHQMIVGLLVHACYLGCVFSALDWHLPAGITAIIVGLQPLLTALMGWQWFGERLRGRQWLGLILGLIGILLIVGTDHQQSLLQPKAIIAALIALFAISIGTVYQKRFGQKVDLLSGSIYQYLSTALAMGVLTFLFETRNADWNLQLTLSLGWLVFGLSVAAILLLMFMIREGKSAKVASYFYLVPPVTAAEAWILFGEALSTLQIGAAALAVWGVYLVLKRS